jgi:hypothetical protein
MSSLLDALSSHLDANTIGALARQIGADPGQTQSAVQAAMPMLLAALARNSAQEGGAAALRNALDAHDGGILGNLAGVIGQATHASDGDGIVGHVLGDQRPTMERGLAGVSGLDADSARRLLALLAPIVMGYLGRKARTDGLSAGSLAAMLGHATTTARDNATQPASILTSLLDRDGDGSVADDLGNMGMGMLGRFLNKE